MDWLTIFAVFILLAGIGCIVFAVRLTAGNDPIWPLALYLGGWFLLCVAFPNITLFAGSLFSTVMLKPLAKFLNELVFGPLLFLIGVYLLINAFMALSTRRKVTYLGRESVREFFPKHEEEEEENVSGGGVA